MYNITHCTSFKAALPVTDAWLPSTTTTTTTATTTAMMRWYTFLLYRTFLFKYIESTLGWGIQWKFHNYYTNILQCLWFRTKHTIHDPVYRIYMFSVPFTWPTGATFDSATSCPGHLSLSATAYSSPDRRGSRRQTAHAYITYTVRMWNHGHNTQNPNFISKFFKHMIITLHSVGWAVCGHSRCAGVLVITSSVSSPPQQRQHTERLHARAFRCRFRGGGDSAHCVMIMIDFLAFHLVECHFVVCATRSAVCLLKMYIHIYVHSEYLLCVVNAYVLCTTLDQKCWSEFWGERVQQLGHV